MLLGAALLIAIVLAPSRPPASSLAQAYPLPSFATTSSASGGVPNTTNPGSAAPAGAVATNAPGPGVGGQVSTVAPAAVVGAPAPGGSGVTGSARPADVATGSPVAGVRPAAKSTVKTKPGTAATGPTTTTGAKGGDTSHCVNGKQFGDLGTAPPCQPTYVGNNGGATSTGVTASTIEIVYYREADSAAVKAVEQQFGIYAAPGDQSAFAAAAQTFINSKYELYGRKVHIDFVQSPNNCSTSPPDDSCFTNDAKQIVSQFHPFAVFFEDDTNEPAFFTTLSSLGVINWGGWGFPNTFDTGQRPFHYDVLTSGDNQAEEFGDWYCKRLANGTAQYAGTVLKTMKRKVGILVQDNPQNMSSAQHLQQIIQACDANGAKLYPYSSDTGSAEEQAVTVVTQMKNDGVTSVAYFSDPIAPVYFTASETSQAFQPENLIVGSALLDYDNLGQAYDQTQWGHAFGIGDNGDSAPITKNEAQTVWTEGGGQGSVYSVANLPWGYLDAISAGLQQAGPTLNPGTFEQAELTLPAVGGTRYQPLIKFGAGDYSGISDYRELYWSSTGTSPIDGKAGTYLSPNNGARYQQGQEPTGAPMLPASQ